MIKPYIEALMAYARNKPTDYGQGESVLTMLYAFCGGERPLVR